MTEIAELFGYEPDQVRAALQKSAGGVDATTERICLRCKESKLLTSDFAVLEGLGQYARTCKACNRAVAERNKRRLAAELECMELERARERKSAKERDAEITALFRQHREEAMR